ncbi:uncharacterized protein LOC127801409 isoform X2 [Diospyros lotus]|uniref:uncharacterized protein LOC127801409 isoform X2 n=1 Tax=Diospyros lotus TaxID=55363 RepID=UPI002257E757|nr:uncharacterized protein LOC127801409 isoform X2 [Diospyros lotus]
MKGEKATQQKRREREMEYLSPPQSKVAAVSSLPLSARTVTNHNGQNCPSDVSFPWPNHSPIGRKSPFRFASAPSTFPFTAKCRQRNGDEILSTSSAFEVLGVAPNCSPAQLKAAFRAKVKQFHPDVRKDGESSDAKIRRVIRAYQILSKYTKTEIIERDCLDPFDEPECEAFDLFVNEILCVGKERAPHAFAFSSPTGTARATSQGHGEDYQVQLAVGQCPRSCIHYVTPSQRVMLEELLDSILNMPYDTSAEADLLYSLIMKARFENNRYQRPKKQPKASTERVDWF